MSTTAKYPIIEGPVRWGILGCGDVTEVKSGPGFQTATGSKLVAVMRRDESKAADYAKRHGVPKWYGNARELIHDPEVDAVYIATPPNAHAELTRLVAHAGKPVYVEKPMARNYEECRQMIADCDESGVPLFVAYYRRCLPRFLKIKELLEADAIGKVLRVEVQFHNPAPVVDLSAPPWRLVPEISGGGIFVDLASHTLDVLDYLLGAQIQAEGTATSQKGDALVEDLVQGQWEYESRVIGNGTWNLAAENKIDLNTIHGTHGSMQIPTFASEPLVLKNATGTQTFSIADPLHVQTPLIQTVVDELRGLGICSSTGKSAARTNWVMDQMLKSWRNTSGLN